MFITSCRGSGKKKQKTGDLCLTTSKKNSSKIWYAVGASAVPGLDAFFIKINSKIFPGAFFVCNGYFASRGKIYLIAMLCNVAPIGKIVLNAIYFASKGKKKLLNAILPLEQWFFTFLMLLLLKYFDVSYCISVWPTILEKQQLQ